MRRCFQSIKPLEVFVLSPAWDDSLLQGQNSIKLATTHLCTRWKEALCQLYSVLHKTQSSGAC